MRDKKQNTEFWLYGKNACIAALANRCRKIKKIVVTKQNAHLIPKEMSDKTTIAPGIKFLEIIKISDRSAQGIAILTEPLIQNSLQIFLKKDVHKHSRIVILDQIVDPQNVGAILRSAAAFAANAVISTFDNAPSETPSMAKAASGAFELIPFIKVINLASAITELKKHNYWIIGLDGSADTTINQFDHLKYEKLVIIIGSEGTGIRRLTAKYCDFLLSIPISKYTESLNASCAAAITLYKLTQV